MKLFIMMIVSFFGLLFAACPPAKHYVVTEIRKDYLLVTDEHGNCYEIFNSRIPVKVGDTVAANRERGVYKVNKH